MPLTKAVSVFKEVDPDFFFDSSPFSHIVNIVKYSLTPEHLH